MQLSKRYIGDRFLPDKAIDLMDEAASQVRMTAESSLSGPEGAGGEDRRPAPGEGGDAIAAQDFEKAAQLRDIEKRAIQDAGGRSRRDKWRQEPDPESPRYGHRGRHRRGGGRAGPVFPVTRLTEDESMRLLKLEEKLHQRVVGQDEAVTAVAKAIRRSRVGSEGPQAAHRLLPVPGPHGRGQD